MASGIRKIVPVLFLRNPNGHVPVSPLSYPKIAFCAPIFHPHGPKVRDAVPPHSRKRRTKSEIPCRYVISPFRNRPFPMIRSLSRCSRLAPRVAEIPTRVLFRVSVSVGTENHLAPHFSHHWSRAADHWSSADSPTLPFSGTRFSCVARRNTRGSRRYSPLDA